MKKTCLKLLVLAMVLVAIFLNGCGKKPGDDEEPPVKVDGITTIPGKKDDDVLPDKATPTPTKEEPVYRDDTEVEVTRISGSETETFIFRSDYEWFAKEDEYWTLDLNGNTVVVSETVHVKAHVTVTNGKLVIKAEPGFIAYGKDANVLIFDGEAIGPLEILVSSGAIGVYANGCTTFRNIKMEVYGIGALCDPATSALESDEMYTCTFYDSTVDVYGGAAIGNPTGVKTVLQQAYNNAGRNSVCNVYEGAFGIDNYGIMNIEYAFYFENINVFGGCGIYNHKDGVFGIKEYSQTQKFRIDGGIGVSNEGEFNCKLYVELKQGNAVFNKGVANIKDTLIFTTPGELFTGSIIHNDKDSKLIIKELVLNCFSAVGAIGIDNYGNLEGSAKLYGGLMTKYENNIYLADYKREHPETEAFFAGKTNVFEKTKLLINEPDSNAVLKELYINLNSTDGSRSGDSDGSIGFWNRTKLSAVKLGSTELHLKGEGGVGLLNDAGCMIITNKDTFKPSVYITIANKTSYNIDRDEYKEALKTRKDAPKKCAGIINNGTLLGFNSFNADIFADECVGIDNRGEINCYNEDEYLHGTSMFIYAAGNKNSLFLNKKWFGVIENNTGDVRLTCYGDDNVLCQSSSELTAWHIALIASGKDNKLFKNTGNTECYSINLELADDYVTNATQNAVAFDNDGNFYCENNFNVIFGEEIAESTVIKNGGSMECFSIKIAPSTGEKLELMVNNGTLKSEKINMNSGKTSDTTILRNNGTIYTKTMDILAGSERDESISGITGIMNTGEIHSFHLGVTAYNWQCKEPFNQNGVLDYKYLWDEKERESNAYYNYELKEKDGKISYREYYFNLIYSVYEDGVRVE